MPVAPVLHDHSPPAPLRQIPWESLCIPKFHQQGALRDFFRPILQSPYYNSNPILLLLFKMALTLLNHFYWQIPVCVNIDSVIQPLFLWMEGGLLSCYRGWIAMTTRFVSHSVIPLSLQICIPILFRVSLFMPMHCSDRRRRCPS
jgi:hypothetical protein